MAQAAVVEILGIDEIIAQGHDARDSSAMLRCRNNRGVTAGV